MIERAERMEIAHMGGRIQAAAQERVQKIRLPMLEEVQELGRRLLYIAALDEIKVLGQPLWADDPRLLVAKLEATVDGCRWLLARWAEFRHLLDGRTHWELPVLLRFIRLQGKLVDESVFDPALNAIFLAWDVLIPKFAKHYWEKFRENRSQADTACLYALRSREIAPRPGDQAEAWKTLYAVVEQHIHRLEALLVRNKDMEAEEANDWVDRAALDLSPEFERHRHYLSAKTRELHKTLETLRKMQESDRGDGKCQMTDGTCQMTDGKGEMSDGKCQMTDGKCEMTDGECEMTDGTCQMTDGKCQMTDGKCQMTDGTCQMTDGTCQMTDGKCPIAEDTWRTADDQCLTAVPEEVKTNEMCQAAESGGPASVESELPGAVRDSILYGPAMSEKIQNKANLEMTQITEEQEIMTEVEGMGGDEQTQLTLPAAVQSAARKSAGQLAKPAVTVRPAFLSASLDVGRVPGTPCRVPGTPNPTPPRLPESSGDTVPESSMLSPELVLSPELGGNRAW